ncbi:MAG: sodium:solute symporter [Lentisphaerae bacterium]|nr:sodium:solute symporter [Lentisphaerota bacterium]
MNGLAEKLQALDGYQGLRTMGTVDWSIVAGLMLALVFILIYCQRYVKSTADFLAANRCAGRYLLTITGGIASIGAISIVANFEQYYVAGFSPIWWTFLSGPLGLIISITGWVFYRFRETRCLTMAQFFEVRYSRNFRVFSGILGWLSGVLNYGIFPAVSVKFFIYFCRLPQTFHIPGINFEFSTFVCLLILAIGMGVSFAIFGGQIAIMLTDFIQGIFCNVAFLIMMIFLVMQFDWQTIFDTLIKHAADNPGQSLFNPYETTKIKDFNIWFFLMGFAMTIMHTGSWQGSSGYAAAAKSAHEAKMSRFLGTWRSLVQTALLIFIPICAVVFFNNPETKEAARALQDILSEMTPQDASQARVPLFLNYALPAGFIGLFAAVMFAAMLSTDDTYMHSWGSIFVQDVILPFRKKPFTEKQHIWLLRASIIFVGVFAFFFSWLFRQTEYILLFFQITGAIFTGGAGAVIIGGLYSRTGTTLGAWVAMILGSGLAVLGIVLQQVWPSLAPCLAELFGTQTQLGSWLLAEKARFPLNGQILAFIVSVLGFFSYFIVSWIDRKVRGVKEFNLDRMLHRGEYDTTGEHAEAWSAGRIWRILGLTNEFTLFDRILFFASIIWTLVWTGVFVAGTIGHFCFDWSPMAWLRLWQFKVMFSFFLGIGTTIWFLVAGFRDIAGLFKTLASDERNHADNGQVIDGQNAGESAVKKINN